MDYVLRSPDGPSFLLAAESLGYVQRDAKGTNPTLITQGITQDGGNYFINVVGTVSEPTGKTLTGPMGSYPETAPIPGYWVRIRVNNGRLIPGVPVGFELFEPVRYLADGVTVDKSYTQPPYGMIA
ncbi:MAG: hypothetical protein JWM36_4346 [Hyphomicrobiales bacterium]|nr:hypothetical protein [Hyphomicrobiales bacterium]